MPVDESASTGFTRRPTSCQIGSRRLQVYLMGLYGLANSGCFSATSVLSSGNPSWHQYGKAIDLGCNWFDPAQRARGDACFRWLMAHIEELGLQQVIWGNTIYDVSYGVRQYHHDDHKNHIHVALGYRASQDWQPPTGTPTVPKPPPPLEEIPMAQLYEYDNVLNVAWVDKNGKLQHDYLVNAGAPAGQGWVGEVVTDRCKAGADVSVLSLDVATMDHPLRRHALAVEGSSGAEVVVAELTFSPPKVHRLAAH